MTILPRGTGIRPTSAEILFPFLDASSLSAFGENDDPARMGRTARVWDLAAPAGAEAMVPGSGLGAWPRPPGAETPRPDILAAPVGDRALSWAGAPGADRLKQGLSADPLHGLPQAQAGRQLLEAPDRDGLEQAVRADAFIFLPASGSRDPVGGAGAPALPPGAEDWFDLLLLPPAPLSDWGPDLLFLPDHEPLAADHVLL